MPRGPIPTHLPHPYFYARALFPPGQLKRLIEPRFRPSTVGSDGVTLEPTWLGWLDRTASEAGKLEPVAGTAWMEMRCYMASTLLRDTDSVSMARSLEVRVPLLDTPLVEFVSSLPDVARHRAGHAEGIAGGSAGWAAARRNSWPTKNKHLLCRGKNGFADHCARGWKQVLRDIAPSLAPHLRAEGVRSVWAAFLEGKTSWSRPWALVRPQRVVQASPRGMIRAPEVD